MLKNNEQQQQQQQQQQQIEDISSVTVTQCSYLIDFY